MTIRCGFPAAIGPKDFTFGEILKVVDEEISSRFVRLSPSVLATEARGEGGRRWLRECGQCLRSGRCVCLCVCVSVCLWAGAECVWAESVRRRRGGGVEWSVEHTTEFETVRRGRDAAAVSLFRVRAEPSSLRVSVSLSLSPLWTRSLRPEERSVHCRDGSLDDGCV